MYGAYEDSTYKIGLPDYEITDRTTKYKYPAVSLYLNADDGTFSPRDPNYVGWSGTATEGTTVTLTGLPDQEYMCVRSFKFITFLSSGLELQAMWPIRGSATAIRAGGTTINANGNMEFFGVYGSIGDDDLSITITYAKSFTVYPASAGSGSSTTRTITQIVLYR